MQMKFVGISVKLAAPIKPGGISFSVFPIDVHLIMIDLIMIQFDTTDFCHCLSSTLCCCLPDENIFVAGSKAVAGHFVRIYWFMWLYFFTNILFLC